jgi:hydrogenase maturation protease
VTGRRYLIGAGNPAMGDDAIGLRVVEEIASRGFDRGFEAVAAAGDGSRLLDYFATDTERIVIVDALVRGAAPGEFLVFNAGDAATRKDLAGLSTHEGDVLSVIEFARRLGLPVPPIRIVGIEPERLDPGQPLSAVLSARLGEYVAACLAEIARE